MVVWWWLCWLWGGACGMQRVGPGSGPAGSRPVSAPRQRTKPRLTDGALLKGVVDSQLGVEERLERVRHPAEHLGHEERAGAVVEDAADAARRLAEGRVVDELVCFFVFVFVWLGSGGCVGLGTRCNGEGGQGGGCKARERGRCEGRAASASASASNAARLARSRLSSLFVGPLRCSRVSHRAPC